MCFQAAGTGCRYADEDTRQQSASSCVMMIGVDGLGAVVTVRIIRPREVECDLQGTVFVRMMAEMLCVRALLMVRAIHARRRPCQLQWQQGEQN